MRHLARRDLLGEDSAPNPATVTAGPWVSALLAGQQGDGGFGGDPYRKWTGAHWRLVSLAELDVPSTDPRVAAAAEHVLAWIVDNLRYPPRVVDGLPRSHASVQGNALGACARLGLAADERTERLAEAIISWQWPDGGWNCDNRADGHRSSFHESLRTAWGLQEYAAATGHAECPRSRRPGRRAVPPAPGVPPWRHWRPDQRPLAVDALPVVLALRRALGIARHRARGQVPLTPGPRMPWTCSRTKRRPDGRWNAQAQWWRPSGSKTTPEVVDWGKAGEPNLMVTLNALRVLTAAGRVS